MIIEIDGIAVEIIPKRIKNLILRVYPEDGAVKLSVPLRYSKRHINTYLREKLPWIIKQKQKIQAMPAEPPLFQTGSAISFKGNNYILIVEEHHGPSQIQIKDQIIHCHKNNSSSISVEDIIDNWYRREMRLLLPNLIKHWQIIVGVQVREWTIKKMKTRWGSCNPASFRICLNLNLIQRPLVCLEYVLVHELVHLLEPSHNQRFYALMKQFMPLWKDYHFILAGKKTQRGQYETLSF